jgi:hypothetical protein
MRSNLLLVPMLLSSQIALGADEGTLPGKGKCCVADQAPQTTVKKSRGKPRRTMEPTREATPKQPGKSDPPSNPPKTVQPTEQPLPGHGTGKVPDQTIPKTE